MSTLTDWYPGDRPLDWLLVTVLVVALVSSAAWILARRLANQAALRHLVLYAALMGCVASPVLAWLCSAAGLTLISIPVLGAEPADAAAGVDSMEAALVCSPVQESSLAAPVGPKLPLPDTKPTIGPGRKVLLTAGCPPNSGASMPSGPTQQTARGQEETPVSFRELAAGVIFVWAAGALLLLARLARNCARVVQLRRSACPLANEAHQAMLREVTGRMGSRQLPQLLVSSHTIAPLAVGFGRPAVILPQRLLGEVNDDELRDILLHEVAHLQRGDQRTVLLQELAGALYWPILSVHGLNCELRQAREELSDNVVLTNRDAIGYGKTLLHVAELLVQAPPMAAAVGILGGPGKLERRIIAMIDRRRNTRTAVGRKAAFAVMVLFLGGVAIASATRFTSSASAAGAFVQEVTEARAEQCPPANEKPLSARDPDDPKLAGHFWGRVNGPDGKPLTGAQVFLVPFHGRSKDAGPVRARTDADGHFEFDAPDMTYIEVDGLPARREGLLMVTKDGYAPDWFHTWGKNHSGLQGHLDPSQGDEVNLQLAKDDVPIHGRFLDPNGRPLAGARVLVTNLVIPRNHDLSAQIDRDKKLSLVAMGDNERELYHPQIPGLDTETRTGADGRFKLSGIGRDRLAVLKVTAPSVVDTHLTAMTRDGPDVGTRPDFNGNPTHFIHGAGFTLQLQPGLTIKGRVIDRDSREPIPGMWVGPLQNALNEFSSSLYPWVTDEQGRFMITGLDPGFIKLDRINMIVAAAPPGLPYQTTWVEAEAEVLLECRRGIPFHLKVLDEQGRPVQAEVTYVDVQPNDNVIHDEVTWPVSRAARKADGTYQGYVLPGPGAVLVRTRRALGYRPAHVDPKAFFAPGRTNWTKEEQQSAYRTQDILRTSNGRYIGTTYRGSIVNQHDYAAIVLVNPPAHSRPLQLSATVVRDRPRRVSVVDPEGNPILGVQMQDWAAYAGSWSSGIALRAASFPLTDLDPDRVLRIIFLKEDRKLIGFLAARGDGEAPYTVRMQPWAAVTGQLLDGNSKKVTDVSGLYLGDEYGHVELGSAGRFRVDRMVPGQRYRAEVYRGSELLGTAFDSLVLRPGEVRDLGDIRIELPVERKSRAKPGS